ncbi:hypothetical protein BN12_2600008 [Nostocoides japonicum T1-X7]|uniref:Uncharacterized protein n=1 Tax=Nostocoides japonicum T1-X7 TaxID=1194083 RepID=A0A077LZ68_9MICO|nr:hypothetical protein BN12_2600008 [Tetrasphaera japonica T1-X7]
MVVRPGSPRPRAAPPCGHPNDPGRATPGLPAVLALSGDPGTRAVAAVLALSGDPGTRAVAAVLALSGDPGTHDFTRQGKSGEAQSSRVTR